MTNNYKIKKVKKYSLNQIKGRLSNKKFIIIWLEEVVNNQINTISIEIYRDFEAEGESYSILTYKYYNDMYDGISLKDRGMKFTKLEDLIDYLDKNYIKKEEWIIEDEKGKTKNI